MGKAWHRQSIATLLAQADSRVAFSKSTAVNLMLVENRKQIDCQLIGEDSWGIVDVEVQSAKTGCCLRRTAG